MSKVKVVLEFDSISEAHKFLIIHVGGMAPGVTLVQEDQTAHPSGWDRPFTQTGAAVVTETAAPAAPTAPTAPTAPETTKEEVNKAMAGYVGRGGGRTAATARAILQAHGVNSVREANATQLTALLAAFQTG